MVDVTDPLMGSLKDFVDRLVKEHGGWRQAGDRLGVNYQDLQQWAKEGTNLQKFLDKLEHVRIQKKMSRSAFWDGLVRVSRKKSTAGKKNID
jgi:hypothetical protein